jgi:hypothetical protein
MHGRHDDVTRAYIRTKLLRERSAHDTDPLAMSTPINALAQTGAQQFYIAL